MSLDALRQAVSTAAAGGTVLLHAATFTDAQLVAPDGLDERLGKAFTDVDVATGLPVTTTQAQVGPIVDGRYFVVSGTLGAAVADGKPVEVRLSADGTRGGLVAGVDLGEEWAFGDSFPSLTGRTFAELVLGAPWFFFAGQAEAAYPWHGGTLALVPGLSFAATVALDGYLAVAVDLLPGLQPLPSYRLTGVVDPSVVGTGKPPYAYPGLDLSSSPLATGHFTVGWLDVAAPYLSIALVDYGEDVGLAPAVMVAAALVLPNDATPPEIRVELSAGKDVDIAAFSLVNPVRGELALTADQLFFLMAGNTFYRLVPAPLVSFLEQFGFRSFGVIVDYGSGLRVASAQVIVASGQPWVVMNDPYLALSFELDWTVLAPFQTGSSQYATLEARARFLPDLFPGEFVFTISTALVVTGGYVAADASEYVSLNRLAAAVTGGLVAIPESFVALTLEEFFVTVNQPARSFSLSATTSVKLSVLGDGVFELNNVTVTLDAQRPQVAPGPPPDERLPALATRETFAGALGADGTRYSGGIIGDLVLGPLSLHAEAAYATDVWSFAIRSQPGEALRLQDLIDEIFEAFALPTGLFDVGIEISDVAVTATVPTAKDKATKYTAAGTIDWQFSILSLDVHALARVTLAYYSLATPRKYTGKVSATTTLELFGVGATFTVEYEVANGAGGRPSDVVRLIWEGLSLEYRYGSGDDVLVFTADDTWTLGRVIATLVRLVDPWADTTLPSPWDLLDNVSLGGLKIAFNLTTNAVTVSWPLNLDLFFATVKTVDITKTPAGEVNVTLTGTFLFADGDSVTWDAAKEDPPVVPGGGDSAFDLRLLALGQRVTVPDLAAIKTVGDAVDQLKGFEAPPPRSNKVPVLPPGPPPAPAAPGAPLEGEVVGADLTPRYSRDSGWLAGTHFLAVSGTIDLKIIFNDPVLYGLRIALSGEKAAVFKGLEFEILYKKITDTIGMYRAQLKLPDAMRYLQFGAVTVILPVVTVEIYTNGNFKVDFGFPYNLDFTNSFTVQVFPFTGSGGFYLAVLDGTTSDQVPKGMTCGTFRPVVEFGLGMQVGLGKSFSAGILRAEISVTVFGVVEGVVATWRPYQQAAVAGAGAAASPDAQAEYYYRITGTLGVVGKVVGVVDFAIVKAEVELTVYAYVQGTFEAYRSSLVTVEAAVEVSVRISINCGLFTIHISFSFSAHVREQFVIGTDHPQDAPWACDGATAYRRPVAMARAPRRLLGDAVLALAAAPDFGPLLRPAYGTLPLDVFFLPQLSIAGEAGGKADQAAVYSVNLYVSNESRTQGTQTYESFRRLARDTFLWVASSFSGVAKGTPEDELARVTTHEQMAAAGAYLAANADGRALGYDAVAAFLGALFTLDVRLPPAGGTAPDATAFPMPPRLVVDVTWKGQTLAHHDLTTWVTADQSYLDELTTMIGKLVASLLDDLERRHDEGAPHPLLRQAEVDTKSLAEFVFVDWFVMVARYVVQAALDAFDDYAHDLGDRDSIASVVTTMNALGNALTDEQVAWANRDHALAGGRALTVNAVPYPIQAGDTLGGIASSHRLDPANVAAGNATVPAVLLAGRPLTIGTVTHPVPAGGTVAATAALFGLTPAAFGTAVRDVAGILAPLTVLTLDGLPYTTGAGDTVASLAAAFGLDVPALTPSVAGVEGLFDSHADPHLTLPGLRALTNAALWADIEGASGPEHLSGMAARYLLGGLRLPTAGLTFADPAHPCAAEDTCGLQSLTGQQVALPPLDGYDPAVPLTIRLQNPTSVPWVPELSFDLPAEAAAQVRALVAYARGTGLQAPIEPPRAADPAARRPRRFAFRNDVPVQSATPIPVPGDGTGGTPRPRVWSFPPALLTELSRPVSLAPLFVPEIGSADTAGGRVTPRPATRYTYATLLDVQVKRRAAEATTYDLVGTDATGINRLERLLGAITPATTANVVAGVYLLYAPNPVSDRPEGLQYDGDGSYTTFLVQANLSTENNPPAASRTLLAATAAGVPRGLLNPAYVFLSMLWEGSITRSGGYYLTYVLPGGAGLPASLFDSDGVGTVSVLVTYRPDTGGGTAGRVVNDYMSAALVDDPVDPANDVLYLASCPRPATVPAGAATTLGGVAAAHHLGVADLADALRARALSTGATLAVTDVVHQVRRGETLDQVASYFGTTAQAIRDLNPNVDFGALTAGTGLHVPDLTARPAAARPGLTIPAVAAYYDSTPAALAWANRDVPGLYDPAGGPLAFDDLLVDKSSVLPTGNVGLVVTRRNPGESPAGPGDYLEQQYSLLGYDLVANTDFDRIPDALPLPASPSTDPAFEPLAPPPSRRSAPRAASADPWTYRFTVPAARAARDNPVPESTPAAPYPARDGNPYAGAGGFVQLALDWRDMLGNRTWSPFDDGDPRNAYPLDEPPSRVGCTDDVIGLGQWPSTKYDHWFAPDGSGGATLSLELVFDASRYTNPGDGSDAWRRNADADRQVFANAYYQLMQTARDGAVATRLLTSCSLVPGAPVEIGTADRANVTAYVLGAWRYLSALLAGTPATAPAPVTLARPVDATVAGDVVEVAVSVLAERRTGTVLPDFRDAPSALVATTPVAPRLTKPDGATGYTIDWYAGQFRTAFDRPAFALRLATGTPRAELGGQAARETLWSVRLGKTAGEQYGWQLRAPAMFFALAPLSTVLLNRPDVTLYSYTPENGLSATPDTRATFSAVDLDVWARNVLAGIDQVLDPEYSVPAFVVDAASRTAYLQKVVDQKRLLATAVASGLTNVLTDPPLDPVRDERNFDAARDKLRQQLLVRLGNASVVDAVVQYAVALSAPDDPPATAPRLYGGLAETAATGRRAYTTSAFSVPLAGDSSLLTYTFATNDASYQAHVDTTFEYRPSHVEHEIGGIPGIDGYEASSWLAFLDPPAPVAGPDGKPGVPVEIPVPLRAYPAPPALVAQGFVAAEGGDATTTLERAKEWTFRFGYRQVHAAQDRIDATVRFNVPVAAPGGLGDAEDPDLLVRLARISRVLPAIQAVLAQDLAGITTASDPASAEFGHAAKAMAALATLLDGLDVAWTAWVAARASADGLLGGAPDQELPFSVSEDFVPHQDKDVLRVTVAYPTALLPGVTGPPAVVFDGYTAGEVPPSADAAPGVRLALGGDDGISRRAWTFRRDTDGAYLTWAEALRLPQRDVEIHGLDAIRFQNALARLRIIRNADLVAGNPTRKPFVYTTPEVTFRNELTPLLDTAAVIDLALVPAGAPRRRTLGAHLTALFQAFFAGSPARSQTVKLEVAYTYRLGDETGQPVELPVLLFPPAAFEIPPDWQGLGAVADVPAAEYVAAVAGGITTWFRERTPSTEAAYLRFDLTAFAAENTQPLVRVRNLALRVADVEGLEPA
jgi:LysM repeat protein